MKGTVAIGTACKATGKTAIFSKICTRFYRFYSYTLGLHFCMILAVTCFKWLRQKYFQFICLIRFRKLVCFWQELSSYNLIMTYFERSSVFWRSIFFAIFSDVSCWLLTKKYFKFWLMSYNWISKDSRYQKLNSLRGNSFYKSVILLISIYIAPVGLLSYLLRQFKKNG